VESAGIISRVISRNPHLLKLGKEDNVDTEVAEERQYEY
jgi:hypothetical protein